MHRISLLAVVTLVALRLATGWHFYNEGVKKLDPDFSSAGFLRTAKGPLAETFRSLAPGPYGAYAVFGEPIEAGSRDAEARQAIDSWAADYGKRAKQAVDKGQPLPTDVPPDAPGAVLAERMDDAWGQTIDRLTELGGIEGEVVDRLEELREEKHGEVAYYLYARGIEMEELQHEAWRLERLRETAGDKAPPPHVREQIEQADLDVWRTMQPWVASLGEIDAQFKKEAQAIATEAGPNPRRVAAEVDRPTLLDWTDGAVTCVVLGSGICVFLGLATRVAAVLAAGFLLSLIATQPPWVPGADTSAFFAWLVEMIAFLVLAAVGAGRWAGLDGVLHGIRTRYGDLSPKYAPLREAREASRAA